MTLRDLTHPRWLLSSLLIAGAGLFAIGVTAERHANTDHTETGVEGEGTPRSEAAGTEATEHSQSSTETVLGLNLESNTLVVVAVVVSLALAALTWFRDRRNLLLATMAFASVFAVFDIAEIAHQLTESRNGLATLAAGLALIHLATTLVAQQRASSSAP